MQGQSLGQEDPLEKEMAAHSNILDWEVPRRYFRGFVLNLFNVDLRLIYWVLIIEYDSLFMKWSFYVMSSHIHIYVTF